MILTRSASINKIYIPIQSFCRASIKPEECPPHDLLGAGKWLSEELWSASHSNVLSISDLPQFCTPLWGGSWVAADCQLEDKEVMDGEWYTHKFPESSQLQTSRNPLHQQGIWNTYANVNLAVFQENKRPHHTNSGLEVPANHATWKNVAQTICK